MKSYHCHKVSQKKKKKKGPPTPSYQQPLSCSEQVTGQLVRRNDQT
jgi:hypothetical protein